MVAEAVILVPFGWLAAPLMNKLFDKALHYLGTGMDERKKKLAATVLPRLSLAIEKAEKSPYKEKLREWLTRLKGAYYEAEEAIDLFEYELLEQKVRDDKKTLQQMEKSERGNKISLPSQIVPQKVKGIFSIFSPDNSKLKSRIDKLLEIAEEANEFRDLLEGQENGSGINADRETISENPDRVFGRDVEKKYFVSLLTEEPFNYEPAIPIVIKNMIEIIVGLIMIKPLNSELRPRTRPVIPIVIKNMMEIIVGVLTRKPLNYEPGLSTRPVISIIAITGHSGIGQTALAQFVYKDMDRQKYFDLLMWVHAPRKFNATDVIKNMIEIIRAKSKQFNCNDNPSTSLEALSIQLRNMLGSKKLLLVLDDFWSDLDHFVEQWVKFVGTLTTCLPGSKILLTTQSILATKHLGLDCVTEVKNYYLEEIEEGQFLELFMHHAWPRNCHLQKEEFHKIGRKIAVKLKGDPGGAKLVGHQLKEKLDLRHWEEVAEKDWFKDNMKARLWSYPQLPLDLQRCLAICSLFPKGVGLPATFLIHLWIAEGFIRPNNEEDILEDIGANYLCELVSRFFLDPIDLVNKKGTFLRLHDLLHDLVVQVQGDDIIRIDSTNSKEVLTHMLSKSENIRHVYLPSSMINELKEKLYLMKNICTFYVVADGGIVPKKILHEIMKHMVKLRVLALPECVDDLPDSIGNLRHLRYLQINDALPLKKLPDSICKLYHLLMLDLPNCESLPKNFCELISLRHFYTFGKTMPQISHVGRLTSLRGIDQFTVRKEGGYELHQLENLNQLQGEMCITGLENVGNTRDAVKANMRNKKHPEKLEFEWNFDERDTENVTGLSTKHVQLLDALQPHANISVLTLKGFQGDRFPNWLLCQNSLKHLTSLTLTNCHNVEEITSTVESLPNCKSLILQSLRNLKKLPALPLKITYFVIDNIPELTYCSENDLLMKEERKKIQA